MYIYNLLVALVCLLIMPVNAFAETVPAHAVHARFDLQRRMLEASSKISLPPGKTYSVDLAALKIKSAALNGKPIVIPEGNVPLDITVTDSPAVLETTYTISSDELSDKGSSGRLVFFVGSDAILLSGRWYPFISGLSTYSLTATVPSGLEALSEAEEITFRENHDKSREYSFVFPHPLQGLHFVAAPFQISTQKHGETTLAVYTVQREKEHAGALLDSALKQVKQYESVFGQIPYRRLSIVVSPTSFSMTIPTAIILKGSTVSDPSFSEKVLGRELAGQWFGSSVYVNYAQGNWAYGLATFFSDYLDSERKGKGPDYRKGILMDYRNYITPENDLNLTGFTGPYNRASEIIGDSKSVMVFHMLRKLIGEQHFMSAVADLLARYKFTFVNWEGLRSVFEAVSGQDLSWFFSQWTAEKGAAQLSVRNVRLKYTGPSAVVSFQVVQAGKPYKLAIPLLLKTRQGEIRKVITLGTAADDFEIETQDDPVELVIDDAYDLFRELSQKESPPLLSGLLGDSKKVFVVPSTKETQYEEFQDVLKKSGYTVKKENDLTYEEIKVSSLLIPGNDTTLSQRLFGSTQRYPVDFYAVARDNPFNPRKTVVIIDGSSASAQMANIPKLYQYADSSTVMAREGKIVDQQVSKSQKGLRYDVTKDVTGISLSRTLDIETLTEAVSSKKVVYIGELHDRFEHHRVQLNVIKELYKRNRKLAIGMEMFSRQAQTVLDSYISGDIDEKEFLKKSGYFKNWGFDYNLYREIMLFARHNRIPVIALNIPKEVVSKVSKGGVLGLSPEDRNLLPGSMDLTNRQYSDRLRSVFMTHRSPDERSFDFFYQAQVLWDETMAHSVDEYLRKNPEYRMVVLAGGGHLSYGDGIPARVYRLNGSDYSIVLNGEEVERGVADFIFYPSPITAPESPKLMVMLSEEDGNVRITDFGQNSVAEAAGLKQDDVIISIDNEKIGSVEDLKIFLLAKKKGDEIVVNVVRKRFLFGSTEIAVIVKL